MPLLLLISSHISGFLWLCMKTMLKGQKPLNFRRFFKNSCNTNRRMYRFNSESVEYLFCHKMFAQRRCLINICQLSNLSNIKKKNTSC